MRNYQNFQCTIGQIRLENAVVVVDSYVYNTIAGFTPFYIRQIIGFHPFEPYIHAHTHHDTHGFLIKHSAYSSTQSKC